MKKALIAIAALVLGVGIGWLFFGVPYCTVHRMNIASERQDSDAEQQTPTTEDAVLLRVYLVRHAEAYRNMPQPPGTPLANLDSLTPRGQKQAAAVGRALENKGIVAVIASPTGRTRETARLISSAVGLSNEHTVDEAFRCLSAGQSLADGAARAIDAVKDLAKRYRGKAVVVVSHGDICPALLDHAATTSMPESRELHSVQTGSVSEIEVTRSGWRIVSVDVRHLDI